MNDTEKLTQDEVDELIEEHFKTQLQPGYVTIGSQNYKPTDVDEDVWAWAVEIEERVNERKCECGAGSTDFPDSHSGWCKKHESV